MGSASLPLWLSWVILFAKEGRPPAFVYVHVIDSAIDIKRPELMQANIDNTIYAFRSFGGRNEMIERLPRVKHLIGKLVRLGGRRMTIGIGLGFFKASLNDGNVVSRGCPVIFHSNLDPPVGPRDYCWIVFNRLECNIRPQLPLRSIRSALYQFTRCIPQASRVENEKAAEKHEQQFGRVIEKSVVPIMLCGSIGFGFLVLRLGDRLRDQGRKQLASAIVFGGLFVAAFGWLFVVLLAAVLNGRL